MYEPVFSKQFERSYRKLRQSGKLDRREVEETIAILASGRKLDPTYKDHILNGEYAGCRECHIRGNILLIYKIEKGILVLLLVDIGTHPALFG